MSISTNNKYTSFFFYSIILISIYRLIMLNVINPNMYVDEAYYWVWAQNFDFGYYSKPPMIAWVISLFSSFLGDSSLAVKSISIYIYPITAIVIFYTLKELYDEKVGFYGALIFFTMPAVSISSLIISTDVVLLLFWSLTFFMFIRALKTDDFKYWILAGIFGGLGLLSKYNMILFVVSVFLYLAISNDNRKVFANKKFYITLILALIVFLPNLLWNYSNSFISFVHLQEISQVERELFHFDKMLEFLGAQFGIFGLVSFGVLLFFIVRFLKYRKDDKLMMLFIFSIVFLAVITLQSFLSRAFANWAAPTYVCASMLVAAFLIQKNKEIILKISLAINILFMSFFYHYESIMNTLNVEITKKNDPFKRVRGWKELSSEVEKVYEQYPNHKLLTDGRKLLSTFMFYMQPHPLDAKIFNPNKKLQNYFHQMQDLNENKGENFIYVNENKNINMDKYFASTKFLEEIEIKIHKDYSLKYYVYKLDGFKGY